MGKNLPKVGFGLYLLSCVLKFLCTFVQVYLHFDTVSVIMKIIIYGGLAGLGIAAFGYLFKFLEKWDIMHLVAAAALGAASVLQVLSVIFIPNLPSAFSVILGYAFIPVMSLKAVKVKKPALSMLLFIFFGVKAFLELRFNTGDKAGTILILFVSAVEIGTAFLCRKVAKRER